MTDCDKASLSKASNFDGYNHGVGKHENEKTCASQSDVYLILSLKKKPQSQITSNNNCLTF